MNISPPMVGGVLPRLCHAGPYSLTPLSLPSSCAGRGIRNQPVPNATANATTKLMTSLIF